MRVTFPQFATDFRTVEEADHIVKAIARIIQQRSLVMRLLELKLWQLDLDLIESDYGPDAGIYFLEGNYKHDGPSWDGKFHPPDKSNVNYHYFEREQKLIVPIVNRIVELLAGVNDPLTDEQRQALHSAVDRAQ